MLPAYDKTSTLYLIAWAQRFPAGRQVIDSKRLELDRVLNLEELRAYFSSMSSSIYEPRNLTRLNTH